MTAANLLAYTAQIAFVVVACAGVPRLLGLRAPGVQYGFWRVVLLACLALPFVQPLRPEVVTTSPSTVITASPVAIAIKSAPGDPVTPAAAPIDWWRVAAFVWLLGCVGRLTWIAAGVARLRALERGCAGVRVFGHDDLQDAIGTHPAVLWSTEVRHPVTFGIWRPVVLLPVALKAVDRAAQRAVIAHELHHVRRRDWGWVIAEEVLRAVFWFHPAMWWLVSRIQLARETVVDELSILATNARRTYLDTLLAFADDSGAGTSPAFSARRHLFHRVMLLSEEGNMSSLRIAIGSCLLVVCLGAGTWGATSAFPLHDGAAVSDQMPPRDPQPPATYHRLAVEYWEKAYKDLSLTPEMRLDAVKKGLASEERALELKPDYLEALAYKNILLRMQANLTADRGEQDRLIAEADAARDRVIAMRKAQGEPERGPEREGPLRPATRTSEEFRTAMDTYKPLRIGGNLKPPTKVHDEKPTYPSIAQASHVQGVVIVEAIIDPTGHVAAAQVLRSIPLLDEAALEAVQQWEFTPTLLNGVPTAVVFTVTVNFSLQ